MQHGPKVHINNTNETIKPTVDSENENDALPFLDCLIKRNTDSTLDTTVYGKRKNTGRFLNYNAIQSYCCSLWLRKMALHLK